MAFVLSMAVVLVFQYIGGANAPRKAQNPTGGSAAQPVTGTAHPDAGPGANPAPAGAAGVVAQGVSPVAHPEESYPVEERTLESDEVVARFSSRGAQLVSWELKKYEDEHKHPLELMRPAGVTAGALLLTVAPGGTVASGDLDTVAWAIEDAPPGALVFRSPVLVDGTFVRKRISFARATTYALDVDLEFVNPGPRDVQSGYTLLATSKGITPDDDGREFVPEGRAYNGPVFAVAGVLDGEHVKLKSEAALKVPEPTSEKKLEYAGNTTFGGVVSKYFAAVLIPPVKQASPSTLFFERVDVHFPEQGRAAYNGVRSGYRVLEPASRFVVRAGAEHAAGNVEHYRFFAGPKVDDVLAQYAPQQLGRLLDYTSYMPGAESLSSLFLAVLRWLHGATGNWGIAIILLTLLVRAAVHPISRASARNMDKMQRLSPKMKEIQKKYEGKKSKEAQQKQTLEMMELYKKHNASPVLGCLPMLMQLPVFIGLYNALAYSIELRHTEFLYIHDLSKPDRLFAFGGANVPFFGGYFNLLAFLQVGTMILSQRMQPPPIDPTQAQQAKMMQYMVVFMGALFYHVPSGLLMYIVTSSLLGMVETKWVKAQIAKEHAAEGT